MVEFGPSQGFFSAVLLGPSQGVRCGKISTVQRKVMKMEFNTPFLTKMVEEGLLAAVGLFDPGSTIRVLTGSPPASFGDPESGTLLWVADMGNPAFAEGASPSEALGDTPWSGLGLADGTPGYFRLLNSLDEVLGQGLVDTAAGEGLIEFAGTGDVIDEGETYELTTFVIYGFAD